MVTFDAAKNFVLFHAAESLELLDVQDFGVKEHLLHVHFYRILTRKIYNLNFAIRFTPRCLIKMTTRVQVIAVSGFIEVPYC